MVSAEDPVDDAGLLILLLRLLLFNVKAGNLVADGNATLPEEFQYENFAHSTVRHQD